MTIQWSPNPITAKSEQDLARFVRVLDSIIEQLSKAPGAQGFQARQLIVTSIQALNSWDAHSVILSSLANYELAAHERKVLERGALFFSKKRIKIQKEGAVVQLLELRRHLVEYQRVLARLILSGKALSASNEGSFALVNGGGFDAKVLTAMGKHLQKAGELLADKNLADVNYGEVVLTKTVLRGHQVLAFYRRDEDRLYIRGNRRGATADDMIHAIIHELGHRLFELFFRPEHQRYVTELYKALERESFKDAPPPRIGQRIFEGDKEYEVLQVVYPRVVLVNLQTQVKASVPLRAWSQVAGTSLFVTPYARKSPEENFCEMLAFYCMDRLKTAFPGSAGPMIFSLFQNVLRP